MINSRYFGDIESAREFEAQAKQMFNYATDKDVIDAACYFQKGSELMQRYLTSKAIAECKAQEGGKEE